MDAESWVVTHNMVVRSSFEMWCSNRQSRQKHGCSLMVKVAAWLGVEGRMCVSVRGDVFARSGVGMLCQPPVGRVSCACVSVVFLVVILTPRTGRFGVPSERADCKCQGWLRWHVCAPLRKRHGCHSYMVVTAVCASRSSALSSWAWCAC